MTSIQIIDQFTYALETDVEWDKGFLNNNNDQIHVHPVEDGMG